MIRKRLSGRLIIDEDKINYDSYRETCIFLTKEVPGGLLVHVKNSMNEPLWLGGESISFIEALDARVKLLCITGINKLSVEHERMLMELSPKIIYLYYSVNSLRLISNRTSLLNGIHVVDVLKAIWGPPYAREVDLERV